MHCGIPSFRKSTQVTSDAHLLKGAEPQHFCGNAAPAVPTTGREEDEMCLSVVLTSDLDIIAIFTKLISYAVLGKV